MDWDTLGLSQDPPGEPFSISQAVRQQHLYILGRTGAGKSTLLSRLALSDIARGDGLLVLDPHGDLVEDIIDHCPDDQWDRIIYLEPFDREYPVPFNVFECKPEQDRDTITSEVIGVFKRLYGDMWGPLLEDLLRSLTLTMLDHQFLDDERVPVEHRYNATLKEAHDFLFDQEMRTSYYPFISNDMVLRYWVDFYDHLGTFKGGIPVTQQQIRHSSSTTNKLRRFLLNPLMFDIMANRDFRNTIDLRDIMDEKKVLLVNLSKGRLGEDNSSLLGSVLLSRLVVAALSRADVPRHERSRKIFHVIADEFQAFATESFKLLLSEARKYGVTLTIAHQHREQLDMEMKGAALNCGSLLCFRLLGRDAADVGREFDATPGLSTEARFEPSMVESITTISTRPVDADGERGITIEERRNAIGLRLSELRRSVFNVGSFAPGMPTNGRRYANAGRLTDEEIDTNYAEQRALESENSALVAEVNSLDPREVIRTGRYARTDSYTEVKHRQSFVEREHDIANELTQLPNYHAKTRLANGSHEQIRTLAMPDENADRQDRIKNRRLHTRRTRAIQPEQRLSVREAPYFGELRRRDAAEYEAELDDQPDEGTPASSTP